MQNAAAGAAERGPSGRRDVGVRERVRIIQLAAATAAVSRPRRQRRYGAGLCVDLPCRPQPGRHEPDGERDLAHQRMDSRGRFCGDLRWQNGCGALQRQHLERRSDPQARGRRGSSPSISTGPPGASCRCPTRFRRPRWWTCLRPCLDRGRDQPPALEWSDLAALGSPQQRLAFRGHRAAGERPLGRGRQRQHLQRRRRHWTGASWSVVATPVSAGCNSTGLLGISGVATGHVFAVGDCVGVAPDPGLILQTGQR